MAMLQSTEEYLGKHERHLIAHDKRFEHLDEDVDTMLEDLADCNTQIFNLKDEVARLRSYIDGSKRAWAAQLAFDAGLLFIALLGGR